MFNQFYSILEFVLMDCILLRWFIFKTSKGITFPNFLLTVEQIFRSKAVDTPQRCINNLRHPVDWSNYTCQKLPQKTRLFVKTAVFVPFNYVLQKKVHKMSLYGRRTEFFPQWSFSHEAIFKATKTSSLWPKAVSPRMDHWLEEVEEYKKGPKILPWGIPSPPVFCIRSYFNA